MNLVDCFAAPLWQAVAWTLVHFVWQGALVAAVLIALVGGLRIERVQIRYACSLVALAAMIALPLGTFGTFLVAGDSAGTSFLPLEVTEPAERSFVAAGVVIPANSSFHEWFAAAQPYVVLAWLAGVMALNLRLAIAYASVRRLRRQLGPLPHWLAEQVEELRGRLAVSPRAAVWLSSQVVQPMALGLVRPLVLLPMTWATEMPPDVLAAIVAHELAHVARRDLWINLVQRLVEALLFYHPAVWWLSRRIRQEREMCCDELAVAATGERVRYVEALELVARRRLADVGPVLAASIRGEKNMRLLQRVRNVLGLRGDRQAARLWPLGVLGMALPVCLWVMSSGLVSPSSLVVADDDADRPKEEGQRDPGRRKDGAREGARRKEGPRDGEHRKEGPHDGEHRKEGPRDGEHRKAGPRDGERERPEFRQDRPGPRPEGDRPRDGERRDAGRREGERDREHARPPFPPHPRHPHHPGDRPPPPDRRVDELLEVVRQLRSEVAAMRSEIAELRRSDGRPTEEERERRKREILKRHELPPEGTFERLEEVQRRAARSSARIRDQLKELDPSGFSGEESRRETDRPKNDELRERPTQESSERERETERDKD